jgi:hypothetical protein
MGKKGYAMRFSWTRAVLTASLASSVLIGTIGTAAAQQRPSTPEAAAAPAAVFQQSCAASGAAAASDPLCSSPSTGRFGATLGPDDIVKSLASFAVGKLAGFLLNKTALGPILDPTQAKLDEIKRELGQIKDQVTVLQTSTNNAFQQVAATKLDVQVVPLRAWVGDVSTLYSTFFVPAVNALTSYAAAKQTDPACLEHSPCGDLYAFYQDRRTEFLNKYTGSSFDAAALGPHIHDALVPGAANTSAVTAYGDYEMASNRYLTSTQSDQLQQFYNYFASYEALATWMKAEYVGVRDADNPDTTVGEADFSNFLATEVTGYQKTEQNALPAVIPAHAVIALDANAALRTTTANKPMLLPELTTGADQNDYLFWNINDPTGHDSVGAALNTLNTTAAGGGPKDWTVPAKACPTDYKSTGVGCWDGLMASSPNPSGTLAQYLATVDPTDATWQQLDLLLQSQHRLLWTAEPVSTSAKCTDNAQGVYTSFGRVAHAALDAGLAYGKVTLQTIPWPYYSYLISSSEYNRNVAGAMEAVCRNKLAQIIKVLENQADAAVPQDQAVLVATRSTGNTNYM